jgi:hypothetical protein
VLSSWRERVRRAPRRLWAMEEGRGEAEASVLSRWVDVSWLNAKLLRVLSRYLDVVSCGFMYVTYNESGCA